MHLHVVGPVGHIDHERTIRGGIAVSIESRAAIRILFVHDPREPPEPQQRTVPGTRGDGRVSRRHRRVPGAKVVAFGPYEVHARADRADVRVVRQIAGRVRRYGHCHRSVAGHLGDRHVVGCAAAPDLGDEIAGTSRTNAGVAEAFDRLTELHREVDRRIVGRAVLA